MNFDREWLISDGTRISFLRSRGREDRPRALFIHGSPNQAIYWRAFLNDPPNHLEAVAVDRPGFGESGPGCAVPALEKQAKLISPLLVSRNGVGTILIGQSQGGPIACRMAADYADKVAGIIVSAGALDPESNLPNWYQRLANTQPFYSLLPKQWAVCVDETTPLSKELEQLAGRLKEIRCPVHILHGSHDWLVKPRNAQYLRRRLTRARDVRLTEIEKARHKLPQTHAPLVRDAIEGMARQLGI